MNPQPRKKTGKILVVTARHTKISARIPPCTRVLPPIKPGTNTFQAAHDTDRHISDALRRQPHRSPGYSYGSARLFSRVPIFTHNRHTDNFFTPQNDRIKNFSYLCGLCITKLTITDMPKMKTNAAAKKRFSFTGTGKIKRKHAYHSHILTKKSTKQKRNLCYSGTVSAADEAKIKNLLVK